MRFGDFLRTTVLASAGAASLLAAITIARIAGGAGDALGGAFAAGWWVLTVIIGLWLGRSGEVSTAIGRLLADARTARSLPEVNPARTLLNRLWPLLVMCIGAAAIGFKLPQVSAIAAGFAIVWALSWRRQEAAVKAIEDRDGARFYIEHTSPWRPIRLTRTPGFRSAPADRNGSIEPVASGPPGS